MHGINFFDNLQCQSLNLFRIEIGHEFHWTFENEKIFQFNNKKKEINNKNPNYHTLSKIYVITSKINQFTDVKMIRVYSEH